MPFPTIRTLQQELLAVIHWFHAKGWAPATSTNYSFRNPAPEQETYTISRSGVDKAAFRLEDFMVVNAAGQPTDTYRHLRPSAETLLHTMLYEQPGVNAILHTHSVVNTVYSWIHRDEKAVKISGFELLKGLQGITTHEAEVWIPIFENTQDIAALSLEIKARLAEYPEIPGFLLAGHGLYAWGNSIAEAKRHIETFEFLFECLNQIESRR
ncbi:MAG: methylthioribulose 1-phosphate dehydratase [Saprospiraceae bacterium]|nr:methylthioribulose 1-phosphate dehydratase [Saprospiraceae bacterium]MDZ4702517.1 methylthioribulose 1-phosphate dehydratase [Saprospiraceae bacterium]